MKFFPRKAFWVFFAFLSKESKERARSATSDRWGGADECSVCMALRWNIMFRLFCSRLSLRCLRFFSGVHTRNMAYFRKLCLPIDGSKLSLEMASSSSSPFLPSQPSRNRVCVCVCERKYFKFAHTHAPCVQLEIYQAYEKHSLFSQLPFCFAFVLLRRFVFFPAFRLLIYYVPKKNCYRWSIFNFARFFFGLAIYSMSYHEICLIPDCFNDCCIKLFSRLHRFLISTFCASPHRFWEFFFSFILLKWTCNAWLSNLISSLSSAAAAVVFRPFHHQMMAKKASRLDFLK